MTKLEILDKQEELLWFEHFTNDDGWKLGCYMVEEAKRQGIAIAICIRLNNGFTLFQYGPCGTNISNQNWMNRKYNTVKLMDRSSLKSFYVIKEKGQTLADHGLTDTECVLCGGGFPIRVKGVGNIGVVTVSALPHEADHAFIVDCLSSYLGIEVPRLELS
ncbi:MAG: hypothetical protein HFI63_10015 [Lachnospiraceae bacterium]|nr:hypothetical protein [Lachnospiraceae bacterium]